jgi:outer membrane protein OmpA-like peptidoglycan-associated protein
MKLVKLGGFLATVLISTLGFAQNNLVPNGSFEQTEKKVKSGEGEIALALPWMSPSLENQADIYSTGNKKGYGIPTNDRGYMDVDEGVNYAGFRAYSYRDKLPRTYLQVKLTKALIAGKKYCIKYNVALSKTSKYASNNLGMYISEKKQKDRDIEAFTIKPQIRNAANKIYEDQHVWETVCGVFIATGNERYITIGNFTATADMVVKKDYLKKKKLKEFPQLQKEEAYYYIDDVSVINLEEIDVCACDAADDGGNQMKVVYSTSTSDGMDMDISKEIELINIFFNKNATTPSSASSIRKVIDFMKANPDLNIEIVGHMDKVEEKSSLKDLSVDRAKAVYDYLIKNGIDASRLSYKGMKSSAPLDDSGTQDSLAKNRRVNLIVK